MAEHDPELIGRCFFCRKPRKYQRLKEAQYRPDENAEPMTVLICVPCERETWTDQ